MLKILFIFINILNFFRNSIEDLVCLVATYGNIDRNIIDELSQKYPKTNITNILQVVSSNFINLKPQNLYKLFFSNTILLLKQLIAFPQTLIFQPL